MAYKIVDKKIIKHGTTPGYDLHKIKGEKPCKECLKARSYANRKSRISANHGTVYGYRKHMKDKTVPCHACEAKWGKRRQQHFIGTVEGYKKHIRDYELPCQACKDAYERR